jgi:hypothetical protein
MHDRLMAQRDNDKLIVPGGGICHGNLIFDCLKKFIQLLY